MQGCIPWRFSGICQQSAPGVPVPEGLGLELLEGRRSAFVGLLSGRSAATHRAGPPQGTGAAAAYVARRARSDMKRNYRTKVVEIEVKRLDS
jgi:hypothetical protein